jgi:hypothetical protein
MSEPEYQIRDLNRDFAICDVCFGKCESENMVYEENTGAIICSDCIDNGYFPVDDEE